MEIIPLAADSMGSRSMATFIETDDLRILFDPGASLQSTQEGFPPHDLEIWRLHQHIDRIALFADKADVIVHSHFHPSHVWPKAFSLYANKIVYVKNPNQQTDPEQRRVAFQIMQKLKGIARNVRFADSRAFRFGSTDLFFSAPVSHGNGRSAVVQMCVRSPKSSFLITSDLEGMLSESARQFILQQKPDVLYFDGPPTSRPGFSKSILFQSCEQLAEVLDGLQLKTLILDHHFLRDLEWETHWAHFEQIAKERNVLLVTAAGLRGEEVDIFEARRALLYANDLSSA